ncbi:MAG TPA: lysophospholipid acyltransferase family protein [Saprospiraceae bacterium]|nr:lysophospholipid acyltransferase family protein [Saprospiraceae bacterium]HNL38481.1 lysophospholipid acyltransferase family protein [Saprospiraceae bacterium]
MQVIGYFFTRLLAGIFQVLPFGAIYVMADGLAFLLYRVAGYRKAVVEDNLKQSFPEKSEAERAVLVRQAYCNLADITLESIKGLTTPIPELRRRYALRNVEVVNRLLTSGRSIILTGSHCCNWEWGVITFAGWFEGHTIGVYKPMSNKWIERWTNERRGRDGLILKSTREAFKSVEQYRDDPAVFFMLADQSPSNRQRAHWVRFFNRPTAWLHGVGEIAARENYPIVYYEVIRIRRGFYEIVFSEIVSEPSERSPGQITARYVQALEQQIRRQPGDWLWSHKRWKMKPEGNEKFEENPG